MDLGNGCGDGKVVGSGDGIGRDVGKGGRCGGNMAGMVGCGEGRGGCFDMERLEVGEVELPMRRPGEEEGEMSRCLIVV